MHLLLRGGQELEVDVGEEVVAPGLKLLHAGLELLAATLHLGVTLGVLALELLHALLAGHTARRLLGRRLRRGGLGSGLELCELGTEVVELGLERGVLGLERGQVGRGAVALVDGLGDGLGGVGARGEETAGGIAAAGKQSGHYDRESNQKGLVHDAIV